MPSADTRSLAHFRRREPARLLTGPAWTGDLEAFRRREPPVAIASGMARSITGVGAIASVEAFGALGFLNVNTLTPTSIDTSETFGSPGLQATITITTVGIASGERFGSSENVWQLRSFRRGEPPRFLLGHATDAGLRHFRRGEPLAGLAPYPGGGGVPLELHAIAYLSAVGAIASAQAFGTPTIAGPIAAAGGIPSLEAFGTPLVVHSSGPRHRPIAATVTRVRVPAGEIAR